jgi:hydrophobic/amphiphilic exporter-1 (mainly G- bacteria), HAE1 family
MALSAFSIRRPVTTLMFYAGVMLVGIISYRSLSLDFLPPVSIPRLTIHASCPDSSPEEMDDRIAQPLAAAATNVSGVKGTSTCCRRGTAVITVEYAWGVDMDYAMIELREKLDLVSTELPQGAGRPAILRIDPTSEPVMTIAVSLLDTLAGGTMSLLTGLTEVCNTVLKKRLEQVEGVAQVQVLGGVETEISVEYDDRKLQALGITSDDLCEALSTANTSHPGGTIINGAIHYPLRLLGELRDADDVRDVSLIASALGRKVRLTEVATVRDTIQEKRGWTRYNGADVLILQVRKEAGSNTLVVSRNIREVLNQIDRDVPGVRLHVVNDQAELIQTSVSDVEQAIVWGATLAFLVLFLFLRGLRDPLFVGILIPVSIFATLIAMRIIGVSLNVISLTGLALGIGMLGDNAIIVIENVRRLLGEGLPVQKAIVDGAREINLAVTASTLTNVAVFLPVLFVHSVAQELFADMAITMTVSLLASLLVAVTLVPVLLSWNPRPPGWLCIARGEYLAGPHADSRRAMRLVVSWGAQWLDHVLSVVLCMRHRVVWFTATVMAASIVAAALIESEPAPEIDRKRVVVDLTLESGIYGSTLYDIAARAEKLLMAIPGVHGVYTAGGVAAAPDAWNVSEASPEQIHLEVIVAEESSTPGVLQKARESMHAICAGLHHVACVLTPGTTIFERILRPQTKDIVIRIQGQNPDVCGALARQFSHAVHQTPGLTDMNNGSGDGRTEYQVSIDRSSAERYGVLPFDVSRSIYRLTTWTQATTLTGIDRQTTVRVQPSKVRGRRIEDLKSSAMLCNGVPVPFSQLTTVRSMTTNAEIRRENGNYTVVVTANASGRSISTVADELRERAARCSLPAGYRIIIGGENEEMESSFRSLAVVIALSMALVYMILAAEYESLLYPLVIILTSPLAFIGAVVAMLIAGEKYNVMSLVGLVIMIGAVDNDAVIVVDVITALRRRGVGLHDAIRKGMQQRLRPILMTTATTLLGIVPLVVIRGEGSGLARALTIPLAGGLVSSTLFTLVVIPAVYAYIDPWVKRKG